MTDAAKAALSALRRDYGNRAIDPSDMAANPIEQFRQWFEEARAAEIYEPNAMMLASVGPDGAPSARVVLLKEFDDDGFVFYTDYDSRKGDELAKEPRVALTFWWDLIHRSVRVEGQAEQVESERSDAYYESRPVGSRVSAAASKQSSVIGSRAVIEQAVASLEKEFGSAGPPRPTRWGGYLVRPQSIEFWQGRSNRLHDRVLYRRDAIDAMDWVTHRLSP